MHMSAVANISANYLKKWKPLSKWFEFGQPAPTLSGLQGKKKFFLISSLDLSYFNLCPLSLSTPPCTTVILLSQGKSPVLVLMALCWTRSTLSLSFLYYESGCPNLDIQAWPNQCWVEKGNHFPNWLAVLMLVELRMLLGFLAGQGTSLMRVSVM